MVTEEGSVGSRESETKSHERRGKRERQSDPFDTTVEKDAHLLCHPPSTLLHLVVELDNAMFQADGPLPHPQQCRNGPDKVLYDNSGKCGRQ